MGDALQLQAVDPDHWIVVFRPTSDNWLVRLLSFGTFKHVAALSYLPAMRAWLTYDVGFDGTKIMMVPAYHTAEIIGPWIEGCVLLKVPKNRNPRHRLPIFGWCAPSISRLLGFDYALRCDALYRHCMNNGGININGQCFERPRIHASASS